MVVINDPISGAIELTATEIKLVDARPLQRLRFIKQLGFTELAFPGATHTRYAHSLGSMAMATRMVDRVLAALPLEPVEAKRLRQSVRLAMLFHDLGHAPMSHVSERVMPKVSALGLAAWFGGPDRQACHEDYTVKLLVDSELTGLIDKAMSDIGVTGVRLAALVLGRPPPGDEDAFRVSLGGAKVDLLPLLSQIVSSELDADRMDYLKRDAYFCGVSYGNFDDAWLVGHLTAVEQDGKWAMALQHKGVWAFENFLLARYHMFLSIYYHHTAICFDHLLGRFYETGEYELPNTSAGYLETDDVQLMAALRASRDPWAQAIVRRRAYRLLVETHDTGEAAEQATLDDRLRAAGIDFFRVRKKAVLSKYVKKREQAFPLLVIEPEVGRVSRIEEYTPLYRRFDAEVGVSRVFCRPDQIAEARDLLKT